MPQVNLKNLALTKKQVYYMIYKGVNLGYFNPDTLNINGQILTTPLEVDQIDNPKARVDYDSIIPTVGVTFAQDSIDLLYQGLLGDLAGFRAGTAGPLYGWGDIKRDAKEFAGQLEIIPVKNFNEGNRLESFLIRDAYLDTQTIALLKGKGRFGNVPIVFDALPDEDAPQQFRYLLHGNLDAEGLAPNGIFIICTRRPRPEPSVSVPSIGVAAGTFDRLSAWLFYSFDSSNTALVDKVGGILVGDTSIVFGTVVGRTFVVGDIIKVGSEYMFVSVVNSATDIDVVRNYGGGLTTGPAAHIDTAVITIQQGVYYWLANNIVDWVSSAPGTILVGDVVGASDSTEKGRITNVSQDDGTALITASHLGKDSPDITVTAAAV